MKRFVYFLPPAILVAVALHQIYLSQAHQLSPWKGGGFGMFSSTELEAARFLRVYVSAPDRSEELQIPDSLAVSAARAATLPSDSMLHSFAEQVFRREVRHRRPVDTVRVVVWQTRFDAITLKPEAEQFRDYVFHLPETGS